MPTLLHEGLLELFRNRPALAAELLAAVLREPAPAFTEVRLLDTSLSQLAPAPYYTDHAVALCGAAGEPLAGIIVEVQRAPDPDKRFRWPLYQAALRDRLRAPVRLLVLAPAASVAAWAARPIDTGQPGSPFVPVVVGPGGVPRIVDEARARANPELAVLSAVAHGDEDGGLHVVLCAVQAVAGLDDERATFYYDFLKVALGAAANRALEAAMATGHHEYQSEFARKYYGQGKTEGQAAGKAEGKAEALLAIFAARRLRVSAPQRRRILACTDVDVLDRWIGRAVAATSVDDALG